MKSRLLSLCTVFALAAPWVHAAELVVSTDPILPSSTLELRFDQPMVAKDKVGSIADISPLTAEPAITGEFKWTSSRSGQFTFTKPLIGTTYQFTLAAGLKDSEGNTLEAEDLGEYSTEAFKITSSDRDYPYGYGSSAKRTPKFLIQFNDAVSLDDLNKSLFFIDKGVTQRVPALVRPATQQDFKKHYHPAIMPTWAELAAGVTPTHKEGEQRQNAFVVETREPLPAGEDWEMAAEPDFKNAEGTAPYHATENLSWGTVLPLATKSVKSANHFDSPHEVIVEFNKPISYTPPTDKEAFNQAMLAYVEISPAVTNLRVDVSYTELLITGDFELNKPYTVTVKDGLPGADGLPLLAPIQETVTFTPSPAYVSTSASTSTQQALGNGIFDIYSANYTELRVRVKKLSDGELIKARDLYTESYTPYIDKPETKQRIVDNPFESFPGTLVYEKTFLNDKSLEKSTLHQLNWKDILGDTKAAPVFVEITATPQEGAPEGTLVNRAIVEFTDIGLLLKNNGLETLIYTFSLKTGQPLTNTQLTLMDAERGFLSSVQTDAQGIASVTSKDAVWVLAAHGEDCTALRFDSSSEQQIPLWGQSINIGWESPWKVRHETLVFSDRPVYKPGETVHIKAITRLRNGDELTAKKLKATLVLNDPRNREIIHEEVTFNENGSLSKDIKLPDGAVGWFNMRLIFPKSNINGAAVAQAGDEEEDQDTAYLDIRVDEYKPNSFEVTLDGSKWEMKDDHITLPLSANYYMGKPLSSSAKVAWYAGMNEEYTPPAIYAEYHFGDVQNWWNYGQGLDDDTASDDADDSRSWSAYGDLTFSDKGTATISLPPVPAHKNSLPQNLYVSAEVTDVNDQTITTSTTVQIPGAEFVIGSRKTAWYASVNNPFNVEFIAITPAGEPYVKNVPVEVKIERQEWNTVRVEGAGGAAVTKNQSTLIEELKTVVELSSQASRPSLGTVQFIPQKSGTYFLTATATDPNGKKLLSRIAFYSIGGGGGFPWAWDDGAKMTLQPDKTKVKPGEEISVVVKTPIAGKALVTVERNHIHRHFVTNISPENPVVKVPMTEQDGPNAFISVTVIRGADANPQPDPMPEYKVGYCEIKVETNTNKLLVDVKPNTDTVLPGGEITITAAVKDNASKPVSGAEVTLFAVDEGVLSLMDYSTPDPFSFFNTLQPLAVDSYTTLGNLIKEGLAARYRGNKGIIVGGGGDDTMVGDFLRKNFVATAIWQADLTTDAEGNVSTTFKVPDNLTRYRIMAVAVKGGNLFGSGESAFTINKPLMVEPAVPRFGNVGDEVLVKAVVHNTTTSEGTVEVELTLNDTASLIKDDRPFALVAISNRTIADDARSEKRTVVLKANQTSVLAFPIRFEKTGQAKWSWKAKTTQWSGEALSDGVESTFEVHYPAPELREVHYFRVNPADADKNLLLKVNPQLLESEGAVSIDVSQSRMMELRDTLEYLLYYPYGCVEQTTSSMLPWLVLTKYESLYPDLLQKDRAKQIIQRSVERILNMQTEDGGLAYWPGSEQAELWASAYGGFALYKAKEAGFNIPQASLDKLNNWLSTKLRELDLNNTTDTWHLNDAAFALYTLARAGKAEAAYQNTLFTRRDRMPETARLFLALSMCITNAPAKQIQELIKPAPKSKQKWEDFWLGNNTADGLRLIVCAHLGLTKEADVIADNLLKARRGTGHWGTTFSNAWILTGFATNEIVRKDAKPLDLKITYDGKAADVSLPTPLAGASDKHAFADNQAGDLKVAVPAGESVRARVQVTSLPDIKTFQPVSKGFTLGRRYERLTPAGTLEPAEELRVGDMVVVTLEIDVHKPNRYLAIEDHLPSVFEPINPEFTTQNSRPEAEEQDNSWYTDHREFRHDKALFFTNDWSATGKFELSYLVRVIAEGNTVAPPAKIEAMYEPEHYGLSDIAPFLTLPAKPDNVAGN